MIPGVRGKGGSPARRRFERLYAGRTAVECVTGRLKISCGINDGQVYGVDRLARA